MGSQDIILKKSSEFSEEHLSSLQNGVQKQSRMENIEILRITSMLMVVTLHFLGHGGVLSSVRLFSFNYFASWTIESFAYVAVNCYILISGYFSIKNKFTLQKIITLYLQILFYSVLIYGTLAFFGLVEFNMQSLLYSFLPVSTRAYWFATAFVALYMLTPFLNYAINSMKKQQLLQFIFVLLLLFSIIPNLVFFEDGLGVSGGLSLYWFVCLYTIAAYFRLYYTPSFKNAKWIIAYLTFSVILVVSRIVISKLSLIFLGEVKGAGLFYTYNSIIVLPASVFLFLAFLNWKLPKFKSSKLLLFLSSSTFGIYLIHDNKYLREILWNTILKPYVYVNNWYLVFYMLFSIFSIFIICLIIEKIRQILFLLLQKRYWFSRFFLIVSQKFEEFIERLTSDHGNT